MTPANPPPTVVLMPAFNSGPRLASTLREVLAVHHPVVVISDGTTDGSIESLDAIPGRDTEWFLLSHTENSGKGAAVLTGLDWAAQNGFRFAVVMDSDGQHCAKCIPDFIRIAGDRGDVMVLGVPIFGRDAPMERVRGRKVGNWWAHLETWWGGVEDSLFGFRLLPVAQSRSIMHAIRTARRFDFDTELAVRLFWEGIEPVNIPVPVRYPPRSEGGVTHFRYIADNALLVWTHTRLVMGMVLRIPRLFKLRRLRMRS